MIFYDLQDKLHKDSVLCKANGYGLLDKLYVWEISFDKIKQFHCAASLYKLFVFVVTGVTSLVRNLTQNNTTHELRLEII